MTQAAIRLNFLQSADVAVDGTTQVAFNAKIAFDDLAQFRGVGFRQVAYTRIFGQASGIDNLFAEVGPMP
jgi:hypothetical protein